MWPHWNALIHGSHTHRGGLGSVPLTRSSPKLAAATHRTAGRRAPDPKHDPPPHRPPDGRAIVVEAAIDDQVESRSDFVVEHRAHLVAEEAGPCHVQPIGRESERDRRLRPRPVAEDLARWKQAHDGVGERPGTIVDADRVRGAETASVHDATRRGEAKGAADERRAPVDDAVDHQDVVLPSLQPPGDPRSVWAERRAEGYVVSAFLGVAPTVDRDGIELALAEEAAFVSLQRHGDPSAVRAENGLSGAGRGPFPTHRAVEHKGHLLWRRLRGVGEAARVRAEDREANAPEQRTGDVILDDLDTLLHHVRQIREPLAIWAEP